jgi:hypothetical protein
MGIFGYKALSCYAVRCVFPKLSDSLTRSVCKYASGCSYPNSPNPAPLATNWLLVAQTALGPSFPPRARVAELADAADSKSTMASLSKKKQI